MARLVILCYSAILKITGVPGEIGCEPKNGRFEDRKAVKRLKNLS